MDAIAAPGEHEVLVFLTQLTILLAAARILGWAFGRLRQPSVIGELLAGVLLGPSVFGRAWPDGAEWLFPAGETQGAMLFAVA